MWHTVQCLKLYLRCSVSVHSSKNTRTQDIFKTLIVLLAKMVLNFAQSFFFARIKLVRIRWLQNTTSFPFPSPSPPPAFLIPLFSLPVTKRAPFPIWTVWNASYSWSPKICPTTGSGRGSWSRNIAFFFTTSFHLELRLSLSLIPFSFPIPHPVPRFWQIPLSEKAKEVKSRIPSRHFASSRIPHCRSLAAEKSAAF